MYFSPPSTPDGTEYEEGSDDRSTRDIEREAGRALRRVIARTAAAAPAPAPDPLQPPFSGDADAEDLGGPHLACPREIVSALFWQHAGRQPEEHEIRPLEDYFAPHYRSACLQIELIIQAFLVREGEITLSDSNAASDTTCETDSSESDCESADEALKVLTQGS